MSRDDRRGAVGNRWVSGQFVVISLSVMLLTCSTSLLFVQHRAMGEEVEQAQELAVVMSRLLVQPAVTDALLSRDPDAMREFDTHIKSGVLGGRVVRVKLWTADGTIVYSDRRNLIGTRYSLEGDAHLTLRTGRPDATLSDLDQPDNTLERKYGRLLEVYTKVSSPGGMPLLFESYLLQRSWLAGRSVLVPIVPGLVMGLVALATQLVLVRRSAGRWRRRWPARAMLLRRSLDASEHERRRMASGLHDGIIQSLVGVSYTVAGIAEQLRAAGQAEAATGLDAAADDARSAVVQVRTFIHAIDPPSPQLYGLQGAVAELLADAEKHGLRTSLAVTGDLPVAPEATATLYCTVQEALRNVIAHSSARQVHVAILRTAGTVGVVVEDDGVGPGIKPLASSALEARGLDLLRDLAGEVGGHLEVTPGPSGGTRLTFTLPDG